MLAVEFGEKLEFHFQDLGTESLVSSGGFFTKDIFITDTEYTRIIDNKNEVPGDKGSHANDQFADCFVGLAFASTLFILALKSVQALRELHGKHAEGSGGKKLSNDTVIVFENVSQFSENYTAFSTLSTGSKNSNQ